MIVPHLGSTHKLSGCLWILIRLSGKRLLIVNKRVLVNPPVVVPFRGLHCTLHAWFIKRRLLMMRIPHSPFPVRLSAPVLRTLRSLSSSLAPHLRPRNHELPPSAVRALSIFIIGASWSRIWISTGTGFPGGYQYHFHGRCGNRLAVAVAEESAGINLLTTIKWSSNEYGFLLRV